MRQQILQRIRDCPTLPSLPAVALQILELAQKDQVDLAEIARIISRDPALSSKILKTVNSSFYGRSQKVATISHALVILGLNAVKTLVLGFSLVNSLSKSKPTAFKHINYWRRSVYAATAARLIAAKLQIVQQEESFLAALLADLGMLVLDQALGDAYSAVHERAAGHHKLPEFEYAAFGMTHAEVSGLMANQWKFPPVLATPIAAHHTPQTVVDPPLRKMSEVISLAGWCAEVFVDDSPADAIAHVRASCLERYQIPHADADKLMAEICEKTREIAPLFEVSIAAGTNFEAILKKANETLVDLTLRSQREAQDLSQQNQQLKQQAETDPLTRLANRGRFDQFFAEQFKVARASGKSLALMMIDLDKFKSINDQHGHHTGDQVLKSVAAILKAATRSADLSARYGGEEMCVVMPGATKSAATSIAETLRRAIAARPVAVGNAQINVTVSIGVAILDAASPFREPAHLLKAADLAMYAAKKGGRNCVKVFSIPSQPTATPVVAAAAR